MRPTIRIEGGAALRRKLKSLSKATRREVVERVLTRRLEPMAESMREKARKRTGELADSVTIGTELSPAQAAKHRRESEVEVFAGPGPLPQAIQEEFGNYREEPHPFVTPSFAQHHGAALKGIGADIMGEITKAAKS